MHHNKHGKQLALSSLKEKPYFGNTCISHTATKLVYTFFFFFTFSKQSIIILSIILLLLILEKLRLELEWGNASFYGVYIPEIVLSSVNPCRSLYNS